MKSEDSVGFEWRYYAAWASAFCAPLAIVAILVAGRLLDPYSIYPDVAHPNSPPGFFVAESCAAGLALLGIILGTIGHDTPRAFGILTSTGAFLFLVSSCLTV